MFRQPMNRTDEYTAKRLAETVRKLQPIGVTVPRKLLEAVALAEQRLPALEAQRREVAAMAGSTGPGFTTSVADGDLTGEQILTRLVGADIDPEKVANTFRGATVKIGQALRDTLKAHGEKWVPLLRPVIDERAEACYSAVYDPNGLDLRRDPKGAEYALRDDATALAWGELRTLWQVVGTLHDFGVIPHHGRRVDEYLFSSPPEERGDKEHLDFTRFILLCREEHEPSLYTEDEVRTFRDHDAGLGPRRRHDPYAGTGLRHY